MSVSKHKFLEHMSFCELFWTSMWLGSWKRPDDRKDWRQKEKRATEDEMVGWHHWCNEHELRQTLGESEGQGNLGCCSPRGHKELDTTWRLNDNVISNSKSWNIKKKSWNILKEKYQKLRGRLAFFYTYLYFYSLIYFGFAGSLLLWGFFSSCGKWELLSRASYCSSFSCCGTQAPGRVCFSSYGSQVLKHRLNCCGPWVPPQHVGSSQTRDWTRVSYIGRWILYQLAIREVLDFLKYCFRLISSNMKYLLFPKHSTLMFHDPQWAFENLWTLE